MLEGKKVTVKNRGVGSVSYVIQDLGILRVFTAGESKRNIDASELEKLTFIPGGKKLMDKYLLISDKEVAEELGCSTEPEYFYDEEQVKYLLEKGSIEQFLDCLDFAPTGVLDIVKKLSVELKINDHQKRQAIKDSLKLDVTKAIENVEYDKSEDEDVDTTKTRRAAAVTEVPASTTPVRRYNVTSKK